MVVETIKNVKTNILNLVFYEIKLYKKMNKVNIKL